MRSRARGCFRVTGGALRGHPVQPGRAGLRAGRQVTLTMACRIQAAWSGDWPVDPPVGMAAIRFTTSKPEITWPKTVYCGASSLELSCMLMKNWLPPECGWPVLAIAMVYLAYGSFQVGYSSAMV